MVARVAVAVFAFVLTGTIFRLVASPSGGSLVGAKREFFKGHAGEFDTVFLGSSHVYRAVRPLDFDERMQEAGYPCRSFNFGVQLPNLVETRFLVQELLRERPGLQRIFLEVQTLTPQVDPLNAFQPRAVYWHDLGNTRKAVERTLYWGKHADLAFVETAGKEHSFFAVVDRLLPPSLRIANTHVQHFLMDALLVGRGKDVGRGLLGRRHGQTLRFSRGRGYISLEEEDERLAAGGQVENAYQRRKAHFLANLDEYRASVEALRVSERVFGDDEWMSSELTQVHDLALIGEIVEEARGLGVEVILVVMPQQSADREVERRLQQMDVPVLLYNDPDRHPGLYDPAMRFDSGHLSAEGAELFTETLVRDYVRLLNGVRG